MVVGAMLSRSLCTFGVSVLHQVKSEDFTDTCGTNIQDKKPQVTQPVMNSILWKAGTLAAAMGFFPLH